MIYPTVEEITSSPLRTENRDKQRAEEQESSNSELMKLIKEMREIDGKIREELRWRDNHHNEELKNKDNNLTIALQQRDSEWRKKLVERDIALKAKFREREKAFINEQLKKTKSC